MSYPQKGSLMMKKNSVSLPVLVICMVLSTACSAKQDAATPTAVPTPIVSQKPTYTVQRGTITKTLDLVGRVMPTSQEDLSFRSDGYVSKVYFQRGDSVKKGDILAELETGDLDIQIAQAQLSLKVAETKLVQAQEDNINALTEAQLGLDKVDIQATSAGAFGAVFTVEDAEAEVKRAQQALEYAIYKDQQARLKSTYKPECPEEKLAKSENKSDDNTDDEKTFCLTSIDRARAHLQNAQLLVTAVTKLISAQEALGKALRETQVAQTNPDLSEEERAISTQTLEKAKANYVTAWTEYVEAMAGKLYTSASARSLATDVALAKLRVDELAKGVDPLLALDVEQAKLNLKIIQDKAENSKLFAPFDGQILTLGIVSGSQVSAFKSILTLVDPTELEITVIPTSDQLAEMSVGQEVTVKLTSQPDKEKIGHVRLLPLSTSSDATSSSSSQNQSACISLDDTTVALTMGETAALTIVVETRENVLWLPSAALSTFQGNNYVLVETNGVQRRVDVRLGISSAGQVEILEGLSEGQVVIGP